jgi:hypothetical protein
MPSQEVNLLLSIKPLLTLLVCTVFLLISAASVASQEAAYPLAGHVFYGAMAIADKDPDQGEDDVEILIFGADVQKSYGPGIIKYGFETGALFSIDSSVRHFIAASGSEGGKVAVSVDVNSFLIDYFAGGFVSFEPAKWLRLYVGAGPLIIWALWETEPEASADEAVTSQSDSGFGVGAYARGGVDILFTENVGLSAGARVNETTLSLGDGPGEVDVEGWQYYFGIALRF